MQDQKDIQRARGIYLLPNFFTTAGLFAGFYAIVAAMNGHYHGAAVAIFVAMLMDSLDGRVARLTNTQSAFGAEYDSLADMVSFGIAPALVTFSWSTHNLGKLGWLAAFLFAAAGALRLARFNTQLTKTDKHYFQGLSITASAGVVAGLVWAAHQSGIEGANIALLVAGILIILAGLMVSNIRYHSFKQVDLKGKVPFVALLILVLIFVLIALDPPHILFIIFAGYALSGPFLTLWNLRKAKRIRNETLLAKKIKQE
ncbi:MAG: pssA [Gammaproteobacteria bacterium]|jgi:CDP-diacylglycerol--serine O-phosphatidyltransferase|nr:pssA [Gammaproteobacteria bacterium]